MKTFATLAVAAMSLQLTGCMATGGGGTFAADGFHHAELPYVVHYTNPAAKDFLGPDWQIDNYYVYDDGSIGDRKSSGAYEGMAAIDANGDGRVTRWQTFYFDLKLVHRKTSAVIWLQNVPLGRHEAERNLRNLVEEYADTLSGSGFFAAVDDGRIKQKTYAAKIVEGKETTVGGSSAYDARLELANLDQLRLDPSVRTAIIRIVLVRTEYVRPQGEDYMHLVNSPVLLRVGYSASPSDFDAGLPDFDRFLKLLELGRASKAAETN